MTSKLRSITRILLLVGALLLLWVGTTAAQEPEDWGEDEYVVHIATADDDGLAKRSWFRTRRVLSDMQNRGLVSQLEVVEEKGFLILSTGQEGLAQLQDLQWVTKIERQTGQESEVVYDVQQMEDTGITVPTAPNDVTGIVDLPDGTPVSGMWVYADEVDGWGLYSDLTNISGAYTITLNTDEWWDIYLSSYVPFPHSSSYARPLDWNRRLYITSDTVQNFTLIPISYTITGTVRFTPTLEVVQGVDVGGSRSDDGHNPYDSTDASGLYQLGVTTGTYVVDLDPVWSSSEGYAPPFGYEGETVPVLGGSVGDVDLWVQKLNRVISGTVTDKDTGEPLGDVRLQLERTDGLYNDDNIRTRIGTPTGTYTISVNSGVYDVSLYPWGVLDGYALPPISTQQVEVTTSDVSGVDFVLLPANRDLSGRVTVRSTGMGLEGVQMRLTPGWIYTETTATGHYTFTDLPEGNYTVYINSVPAGYARVDPTDRQVEITTTSRSGVDFEALVADRIISGTVREAGAGGIPGVFVKVDAYDSGHDYDANTTTTASGAYSLSVPVGTYEVEITLPAGYAGRRQLRAPDGAQGVDFELYPQSETIAGQVTDHLGAPVAGASVQANNHDCYGWSYSGDYWSGHHPNPITTDASGNYTLTVIPGSYEVYATMAGYPTPPYQNAYSGDSNVDFMMPEGFLIQGRAWRTLPEGGTLSLPGASVCATNVAECSSDRHDRCTSTDTSGFYTLTVGAGTYDVSAWAGLYVSPPSQSVTVGPDQSDVNFELLPDPPVPTYLITGTVTYSNGLPIDGAWVTADAYYYYDYGQTDANGRYVLTVVSDTYDIYVDVDNWPDPDDLNDLTVTTDTYGVNFTAPEAFTVTGTVRRSDGTPWPDIGVEMDPIGHPYDWEWENTDANGVYTIRVHQGSTRWFYPDEDELPANPAPISRTVDADISGLDFQFLTPVTVSGMVSDTFGNPVPNAQVYIYGSGTNGADNWDDTYTFYDGSYMAYFAEGGYQGQTSRWPCYVPTSWQPLTLGPGGASDYDFTIARKCGTITGQVTDPEDSPVCEAEVDIWYPGGAWYDEVFTALDQHGPAGVGTYRAWVPVGTWILGVSKDGLLGPRPISRTVEVTMCSAVVAGQDFQFTISEFIYLPLVLRAS